MLGVFSVKAAFHSPYLAYHSKQTVFVEFLPFPVNPWTPKKQSTQNIKI